MPGFDFKLFKGTPVWELAKAVESENIRDIDIILRDSNIKVDFHEPKFGNTVLMLAVATNKQKSVRKLLELGANSNERDKYDNATSLMIACEYHSEECDTTIVKCLIQYNGNVNLLQNIDRIENNGAHSIVEVTPLMIAAESNCLGIVKTLVNSGADINRYTYHEGYGAVTAALIQDNLEIAKYLIIDRQARVPQYCFIRNEGAKDEQKLTITDMLNERDYESGSSNYKFKVEILQYLKLRG